MTVLNHVNTQYYALTPGDATRVAPLVRVGVGLETNPHPDRILLTDVYLTQLSEWQWIIKHFDAHVQFVTADQLVEPGIPADELNAQGYLEMSDSKQAAQVAALRALGWKLPMTQTGAVINGVAAPSPARLAHLHVADRVVAADGTPVASSCALIAAVHDIAPGTLVHLSVERAHISPSGVISWSSPRPVALATAPPRSVGTSACPGLSGPEHSWLGISLEDGVSFALPAGIEIKTSDIGGPSAGLAMTLTLINLLSSGSLTGHHTVAATGTIAPDGAVGDVGGVAEKTVAVQDAGATVFIVPSVEVATARAAATPGLRVIGVTTLSGALRALRALGGSVPVPITAPH